MQRHIRRVAVRDDGHDEAYLADVDAGANASLNLTSPGFPSRPDRRRSVAGNPLRSDIFS